VRLTGSIPRRRSVPIARSPRAVTVSDRLQLAVLDNTAALNLVRGTEISRRHVESGDRTESRRLDGHDILTAVNRGEIC
jgi:hypothetical protein